MENSVASDRGPAFSTLSDKVQSLKLSHIPDSGGAGRNWVPWTLSAFFACTTLLLAFVSLHFAENPKGVDEDSGEEASAATAPADGMPAPVATPRTMASSGDVVLESKGYII